jgi:hypothetical protein
MPLKCAHRNSSYCAPHAEHVAWFGRLRQLQELISQRNRLVQGMRHAERLRRMSQRRAAGDFAFQAARWDTSPVPNVTYASAYLCCSNDCVDLALEETRNDFARL